jgi:hypothetical protein
LTPKVAGEWTAFVRDASNIGFKEDIETLDDFSLSSLKALVRVQVTMAESRLMKTIKSTSKPAAKLSTLVAEYCDDRSRDLLEDTGEPVLSYLLSKDLIVKVTSDDGDTHVVASDEPGKPKKDKREKKEKKGKDDAAQDNEDGEQAGKKKDKKDKEKDKKSK